MKKILAIISVPLLIILVSANSIPANRPPANPPAKPKNIIIILIDGMGVSELSAAEAANKGKLELDNFPVMGLMRIFENENLAPDEYANATAIASGVKTSDGFLGVDNSGVRARTLAEYAKDKKMLTGLISLSSVTNPSAAAFFSHEGIGINDDKIARDIMKFKPDILIGGGSKYFDHRADNANLIDSFVKQKYEMFSKMKKASSFTASKICALIATDALPPVTQRGGFLPDACVSAVREMAPFFEGYFLIINDAQTKEAIKTNTVMYMAEEIKDVNKTVADLYTKGPNMDETLVLVLSTCEIGSFAITGGSLNGKGVIGNWQSQKSTGAMVPVFAKGPGSELFSGIYDNTEVFSKILGLMGK